MPQKKIVKKAAKPVAKKAAPAKKTAPKAAKKPAKKSVVHSSKPAPKAKGKGSSHKKVEHKPAVKAAKAIKKSAAPVKAASKQSVKKVAVKHEKTIPMSKQKHKEEIIVSKTKKHVKPEPVKEVKLPKINTKTSVPYQPSYKPLEKREAVVIPNEPLVRYSDNELNEFRELIQRKLDSSKKELAYLQGLITRKDDMGGDESESRYMTMEDGSISMEREQLSQMASRQITYIDHLEKALIRIENKTYGICRVTGKLIDKARLRAVPHATLSLEAKLGLVKAGE